MVSILLLQAVIKVTWKSNFPFREFRVMFEVCTNKAKEEKERNIGVGVGESVNNGRGPGCAFPCSWNLTQATGISAHRLQSSKETIQEQGHSTDQKEIH